MVNLKKILKFNLAILFSILLWTSTYGQVVCAKHCIVGCENECETGYLYNGRENTTIASKSKIYITMKNDMVYIQSNFKPDKSFEHPIKLATPPQEGYSNLDNYLTNIYFFGRETPPSLEEVNSIFNNLKKHIEITIEPSVLNDNNFGKLNFNNYKNLKIACPDGTSRDAIEIINRKKGTREFVIKYNNNISTRIKNQNLDFIFSNLKNRKFDSKKLKIVSLLENTNTKDLIREEFSTHALDVNYSIDDFKKVLLENKGNRTIILGHNENEKFLTLDKSGKVIFEISIEEITKFQKENNLSLLLLCCNSAYSSSTGVLNKFNSIDVLRRLKIAIKNDNIESFLNDLSHETLDFVLDDTFFMGESEINDNVVKIDFEVYNTKQDRTLIEPSIGRIIFLEPITLTSAIPIISDSIVKSPMVEPNIGDEDKNTTTYAIIGLMILVLAYFIFKPKNNG